MNDFRYALIRYIPDMARMEPINVGVILQGQGKIDFKLSPHAAKRKDIDTPVFQSWRAFFEQEIRGGAVPLLQPPKDSVQFLLYLAGLCEHTVLVTKPLALSVQQERSFEEELQTLYDRLVAPLEFPKRGQQPRPTSRYREIEEEKNFRKRGMKKHPYLTIGGHRRWNAFRQALNGDNVVIDKVEVGNSVGLTADEIQKLSSGVENFLNNFLQHSSRNVLPRYYLIADRLSEKFTDQSDDDFQVMQEELKRVEEMVRQQGGVVLREPEEVQNFAAEIDRKLPPLEDASKS